jgi:hemerythrin-like metal-binding protein
MTTSAGPTESKAGGRRRFERAAGSGFVRLEWINAFETGNAEIDDLHRKLVQDCNDLLLLIDNESAWTRIIAEAKKLVESCLEHFRAEEVLLERTRFPRCAEHAAEHGRLEREMQALIIGMEQVDGPLKEHREYPRSLGRSLIDVIIRHDLDYRSHLLHQQGR